MEKSSDIIYSVQKWAHLEIKRFAWSQVEGVITEATLQGVSKFNGKTFTAYSFDALTDGKVMMWIGEFDFISKTVELNVQQIE